MRIKAVSILLFILLAKLLASSGDFATYVQQTQKLLDFTRSLYLGFSSFYDVEAGYPILLNSSFAEAKRICQTPPHVYEHIPAGVVSRVIGRLRDNNDVVGIWNHDKDCFVTPYDRSQTCVTYKIANRMAQCENDPRMQVNIRSPAFKYSFQAEQNSRAFETAKSGFASFISLIEYWDSYSYYISQLGEEEVTVLEKTERLDPILLQLSGEYQNMLSYIAYHSSALEKLYISDLLIAQQMFINETGYKGTLPSRFVASDIQGISSAAALHSYLDTTRIQTLQVAAEVTQFIPSTNISQYTLIKMLLFSFKSLMQSTYAGMLAALSAEVSVLHDSLISRSSLCAANFTCEDVERMSAGIADEYRAGLLEFFNSTIRGYTATWQAYVSQTSYYSKYSCLQSVLSAISDLPTSSYSLYVDLPGAWHQCILQMSSQEVVSVDFDTISSYQVIDSNTKATIVKSTNNLITLLINGDASDNLPFFFQRVQKNEQDSLSNRVLNIERVLTYYPTNIGSSYTVQSAGTIPTLISSAPAVSTASPDEPSFNCTTGRYGPQCTICPKGTWSNDGYLHLCSNAPSKAAYSKEGETGPNCRFTCTDSLEYRVDNFCIVPSAGFYPIDGGYSLGNCTVSLLSNREDFLFTTSGKKGQAASCVFLPRNILLLDNANIAKTMKGSFTLEITLRIHEATLQKFVDEDPEAGVGLGIFEIPSKIHGLPLFSCYIVARRKSDGIYGYIELATQQETATSDDEFILADGNFHHLVFIYNAEQMLLSIYKDRVLIKTFWYSFSFIDSSYTKLAFGGSAYTKTLASNPPSIFRFLPASLDNIRLVDSAIPLEQQVAQQGLIADDNTMFTCQTQETWSSTYCTPTCPHDAQTSSDPYCLCSWGSYFDKQATVCQTCPLLSTVGSSFPRSGVQDCRCSQNHVWSPTQQYCIRAKPSLPQPIVYYNNSDVAWSSLDQTVLTDKLLPLALVITADAPQDLQTAYAVDDVSLVKLSVSIWNGSQVISRLELSISDLPFVQNFTRLGKYSVRFSLEHPEHLSGAAFSDSFTIMKQMPKPVIRPESGVVDGPTAVQMASVLAESDADTSTLLMYSTDGSFPSEVYNPSKPLIIIPPSTIRLYARQSYDLSSITLLPSQEVSISLAWNTSSYLYKRYIQSLQPESPVSTTNTTNATVVDIPTNNTTNPTTTTETQGVPTQYFNALLSGWNWCQTTLPLCIGGGVGIVVLFIAALTCFSVFLSQSFVVIRKIQAKRKRLQKKEERIMKKSLVKSKKSKQAKGKATKKTNKDKYLVKEGDDKPASEKQLNQKQEPVVNDQDSSEVNTAIELRRKPSMSSAERYKTVIKCTVCKKQTAVVQCFSCYMYCCRGCSDMHQDPDLHKLIRLLVCDLCNTKCMDGTLCRVKLFETERCVCPACVNEMGIKPKKNSKSFTKIHACSYCEEKEAEPENKYCEDCRDLIQAN